jgi:transcriptional regulator with XRE-family HTH domain
VIGLSHRLARLREARGLGLKEVSTLSGIPLHGLKRLEGGTRRGFPADWLASLAALFFTTEAFLRDGRQPDPGEVRTGFLRYWENLGRSEREGLRYAPIQGRIEAVLRYVASAFPGAMDREAVAAALGYTPDSLAQILSGAAPLQSPLLQRLAGLTDLPRDFFVRGDLFGGVAGEDGIGAADLRAYYDVVQEAARAGISPSLLRRAVQLLALREDDPNRERG